MQTILTTTATELTRQSSATYENLNCARTKNGGNDSWRRQQRIMRVKGYCHSLIFGANQFEQDVYRKWREG